VQFAKERVALRVSQGGHAIPDDVIERRFLSGWANFLQHYKTIVDEWSLIDASDSSFKVIDWKEKL
jgi:predicted ABC-type ATPase